MKKLFLIHLFFIVTSFGFAQNLKPDFVELSSTIESFVDTDLTIEDVFKVTGFPELEREDISIDDFSPNFGFLTNQSALMVKVGYRSFNKRDSLKFTDFQIALSFGRSRGFDNIFFERSSTPIEIVVDSDTIQIDSFYRYSVFSGFRFNRVLGLQFSLSKTLISYKAWSFNLGFAFDAHYYGGAIRQQHEKISIHYSKYLESQYQGDFFTNIEDYDLNMYSLGGMLPISITYNLKSKRKHLDRLCFSLCSTYGYRIFTIPNKVDFSAKTRGSRFTLRYNLF